jgi:hypothetical protein
LQTLNLEWKQVILLETQHIHIHQITTPKFQSSPFEDLVDCGMKIQMAYKLLGIRQI